MDTWQEATLVNSQKISSDIKSLTFNIHKDKPHIPGQFYILKIKGNDGFFYEREYSLSNATNKDGTIEFGVQKVRNGVVSNYLHKLKIGEKILAKGPLGKYFNFQPNFEQYTFIAGGAGIIPFFSMKRTYQDKKFHLIASFKTLESIPYLKELMSYKDITITITRDKNHKLYGRIDKEILKKIDRNSLIYICGRTSFVEDMGSILANLEYKEELIMKERFG